MRVIQRPPKLLHNPIYIGPASCPIEETPLLKKALACAAILWFAAGFIRINDAQAADLAKGKTLYEGRCLLCHGPKGDGRGQGAIALNPKPADYTKKKFWEDQNIEQKIAETVKAGKGQMRASPDLSPDDIQSIILYMIQTFKPK
jgi:mono/diheme cytochrome c family protein